MRSGLCAACERVLLQNSKWRIFRHTQFLNYDNNNDNVSSSRLSVTHIDWAVKKVKSKLRGLRINLFHTTYSAVQKLWSPAFPSHLRFEKKVLAMGHGRLFRRKSSELLKIRVTSSVPIIENSLKTIISNSNLLSVYARLQSFHHMQGDHSACSKPTVNIDLKVAF